MAGNNSFTAWLEALEVPTETVQLCTDSALVRRATELHAQIEYAKNSDEPDRSTALGDTSAEAELAELRELIDVKSVNMTFRSPSEDEMLSIDKTREDNPEQWAKQLIALASVDPKLEVTDVDLLRKKLDRATYVTLFNRVREIAVTRSLTLPFSWGDSGNART